MEFNNYLPSYLRGYSGNKFNFLDQIITHFPAKCRNFVDMFAGSCCINYNYSGFEKCFVNEFSPQVFSVHKRIYETPVAEIVKYLQQLQVDMSNGSHVDFQKLKKHYNETHEPLDIILIAMYSFANLLSFNGKGECNVSENPYKRGKYVHLNKIMGDIVEIKKRIEHQEREYINGSFADFDRTILSPNDFVYLDPPYFETKANYNSGWGENEYALLINLMDYMLTKNIGMGYSDMLIVDDVVNYELKSLIEKHKDKVKTFKIDSDFNGSINNANYEDKLQKRGKRLEIYLTNRF